MRLLAILTALIACAAALSAEIRIVNATSAGKTRTISTDVREIPEGGRLRILQENEEGSVSTHLDADQTVVSAEIRTRDGTILMANDGKAVRVSGTWKGKEVAGNCDLKGLSFYGYGVEYALRALARNNLKSLKFLLIQPWDPSKSMLMELTTEGNDTFRGRKAIKVKLSLSGPMAAFWSAHFLAAEDGTILKYAGNQGPGTPDMVTELVDVRQ